MRRFNNIGFLVLFLLFLAVINSQAQESPSEKGNLDFQGFVKLFNSELDENGAIVSNSIYHTQIPNKYIKMFFRDTVDMYYNSGISGYDAGVLILTKDKYTYLEILEHHGAGSGWLNRYIARFRNNDLDKELNLPEPSNSSGYGSIYTYTFFGDSLMEIRIENPRTLLEKKKPEYHYYKIHDNGELENIFKIGWVTLRSPKDSKRLLLRKYPDTSNRVYRIHELQEFPLEELNIMRNEIFAFHGYIFKTSKWKEYFNEIRRNRIDLIR